MYDAIVVGARCAGSPAADPVREVHRRVASADLHFAAVVRQRRETTGLAPLQVSPAGDRGNPWAVAARVDGDIQVEWDGESGAVEVLVAPDGTLGYLIERRRDGDVARDEREPVSLAEVYEGLVRLLAA